MWIKICGITTSDAVAAALAARVDAIGFVFADSPRQLTLEDAVALAAPARGLVRCVAVTRQPSQRHLDDILSVFRPDVLQTDTEDLRALRVPKQLELLPVFRGWDPSQGASRARPASLPSRLLFEGPTSGSGTPCDWTIAQRVARRTQLVLAGGLDADTSRRPSARFGPSASMSLAGWRSGPASRAPPKSCASRPRPAAH